MLITPTGLGWQPALQQQQRTDNDQALAQYVPLRQVAAAGNTAAQQNSQGSTSQQNAEDNRKEAFAKLMVMLQNPDVAAREQASAAKQKDNGALQEFKDYMAKSPEEKIKEKLLQELGLTMDDYNALPPEQKAKIDLQITQRMQKDVEMKTQEKLAKQAERADQVRQGTDIAAAQNTQQRKKVLEA
ncbi:MAG: hypothetical protein LBE53_04030 [Paucimonas sp.]|jgi:hypothetical protein|uniref:hypothetical protein n=1 Tax=Pantoea sp. Cy-639 TaxID=2608360 RepID=UPI00196599B6|nr:hypothetical protein [Pantoea sp. Cy-639]MDR2306349.1 hypothetical protein [Paucimonas sp.]